MADAFPSISLIIPRLKEGDEKAWNDLFEKFRIGLTSKTRFLFRTTAPKKLFTPEDLVQETFLKAWKRHASFRGKSTRQFSQWLLTILRNTFFDWCRLEKPEQDVVTWFGFFSPADSPSKNLITLEQEAGLHACLAELPAKYQQVLICRHFEGLKFVEIAKRTGISTSTVAGIYRRALSELMSLIKQRSFNSGFSGRLF